MRKLVYSLLLLLIFSGLAYAGTTTTNYDLQLPSAGDTGWTDTLKTTFDKVDTQMKVNADGHTTNTNAQTICGTNLLLDGDGDCVSLGSGGHGDGSNCSSGSYPLGVDGDGAVQSCTDASTEIDSIVLTHKNVASAHHSKYLDSEVDTIVATHTALGNAHHNESHTVASHSDTTGTGTELNTLTDGSETTLHSHAGGGGSPGGSNTQVQFNDSSSFGGDAGMTYNKITDHLTLVGTVTGGSITIVTGGGSFSFREATATGAAGLVNNTPGQDAKQDHYTADGDGTDDNFTVVYGLGTIDDITNRERLQIGWDESDGTYIIRMNSSGTGVDKAIEMSIGINDNQILLNPDGSVDMEAGDLNITAGSVHITAGKLTVAKTVTISGTGATIEFTTGETADPCGGLNEGTLFYNTTANVFCFCDGTNDLKVADGSACF